MRLFWIMLSASLFAAGCGEGRTNVSGHVSLDGNPISGGMVAFYGPDNQVQTAIVGSDGSYTIDDALPGKNKIGVQWNKMLTQDRPVREGDSDTAAVPSKPKKESTSFKIPERYADPQTSGLEVEVKGGASTHDINLESGKT